MPRVHTVTLSAAEPLGVEVTSQHFGANVVFTRNYLDRGGPFDRMAEQLGFDFLRFPGGTFGEQTFRPAGLEAERLFDVTRPSGMAAGESRIVTAPAAFEYATEKDADFAFVFPTQNYLSDEVDADGNRLPDQFGLYRLLDRANHIIRGDYGEVDLDIIVIGNEFWYRQERMTAAEYGGIVNEVAKGFERVFERYRQEQDDPDAWQAPKIAMQVSQGWRPEDNQAIIDAMDMEARAAVDVVVTHFYPSHYQHIENSRGVFDRLDDVANAEGFGDLEYFISEWNTSMEPGADTGLMQASSMIEIMSTMLERGVDHASVWGTQYQNLQSRLAKLERDPDAPGGFEYSLTPAGEVFRMMSTSLRGTQLLDIDTPEYLRDDLLTLPEDRDPERGDQLVMHAFGGDERVVVFLSSRTDQPMEVTLDFEGLVPDYTHVWAQTLSVMDDPTTPGVDEGDPTSALAMPYITTHTESSMHWGQALNFELDAYEIVRVEFTLGEAGAHLWGHDQHVDPAADYSDVLIGGPNGDLIEGHLGDDLLRGGGGDDTIFGGAGNDTLQGGAGDDLLFAGEGQNLLRGGAGNDTLVAGPGENTLFGNTGENHFVVLTEGDTIIADFSVDNGDTLSFARHYETAQEAMERAVVEGEDIVFLHDDGGTTELLGAAADFDRLSDALSDHMDDSPVEDVVDYLLYEPEDGEPQHDPAPTQVDLDERQALLELADMLTSGSEDGLQEFLDGLGDESLTDIAAHIDPEILVYSTESVFDVFLNSLPPEALEDFFARLPSRALDEQFLDFPQALPPDVLELNSDVMRGYLDTLSPEGGAAWLGRMEMEERDALVGRMDELGLDPADWGWFSPLEEPPDDDPEEEEEGGDDPGDPAGGACFVATCAYGGRDHPDVAFLRTYRDLVLAERPFGRLFVAAYWRIGPHLARALAPHPQARTAARWLLGRIVHRLQYKYARQARSSR